jgi:hypothetical protein
MKQIHVYVSDELYEFIKQQAELNDVPMSKYLILKSKVRQEMLKAKSNTSTNTNDQY